MITPMALRGTRSIEGALHLLHALGYDTAAARPYGLDDIGLTGTGTRLRAHQRRGYGILVAEVDDVPRSFKTIGRRLLDGFHDQPLLILGVRGTGAWESFAVVRPRLVKGGGGAVTIARLVVRPSLPTARESAVTHLRLVLVGGGEARARVPGAGGAGGGPTTLHSRARLQPQEGDHDRGHRGRGQRGAA